MIGDLNYDSMGNITKFDFNGSTVNYSYDSTKKLASTSGAVGYTMAYDARGNVTSNGHKSFSYNLANQMVSGFGNSYLYDGYNRRVKTLDGYGTRYSFYNQAGRLLFEKVNGADRENYYLGSQLIAYKQSGNVTYIHSDLLGSTAATTNSSGGVMSRNRYKPFGADWGTARNEIGYTGHKHDTDLGLTYMQARYYDPLIGRFYSNDPIRFRDIHSFNRYAYANNNPYKYTDPTGMEGESSYKTEVIKPEYKSEILSVDLVIIKENLNSTTTTASVLEDSISENATIKGSGPIEFGASKDVNTGKITYETKLAKQLGPDKANVTPSVSVNTKGEIVGAIQVKVGKAAVEGQAIVDVAKVAHNQKTFISKLKDILTTLPSGN